MKKTYVLLMALMLPFILKSQESTFNLDDKVLNLGIGLGSNLYFGSYYSTTLPALSVSFEKGIKDGIFDKGVLGIGGYAGVSSYKWEYLGWGYRYTNFVIGARGILHYPLVDKLDTYTGLLVGARIVSSNSFGTVSSSYNYTAARGGVAWSWFVGGRYYFTDNMAVMMELGYGISYLTIGLSIKL